jgi:hypothetical protein
VRNIYRETLIKKLEWIGLRELQRQCRTEEWFSNYFFNPIYFMAIIYIRNTAPSCSDSQLQKMKKE